MRDLRKYWQEVHSLAANLPADVWLASRDGELVEAPAEIAAKFLIAKSHRLATEEEIRAKRAAEAVHSRKAAKEDRRKRGVEVVAVEAKPRQ